MRCVTYRWLVSFWLLIPSVALCQERVTEPGQPNWLSRSKPGARLRVIERSGESTTGRLVAVLPSGIRLASRDVTIEVPLAEIALVRRNGDSLWNGTLLGGGLTALIFLGYNRDCDNSYTTTQLAAYHLALAGMGAGVGALVDWVVRDRRVLYRAPVARDASRRLRVYPDIADRRIVLRVDVS